MPSGLEFYNSTGELVYSSSMFKLFRQSYVIEPSYKYVNVGSSGWIYEVKLTYTIPKGRGMVFFGYYGGYVRLSPTAELTYEFHFVGASMKDGEVYHTTAAELQAKYKMNAHVMEF